MSDNPWSSVGVAADAAPCTPHNMLSALETFSQTRRRAIR